MVRTNFSGQEIATVLRNHGFKRESQRGSHLKLRYEHPETDSEQDYCLVIDYLNEMDELMKWLLPGGIGILLVFIAAINTSWEKGMRIAVEGDMTQVSDFIGDWIIFGLLVVLVLVIFGVISTVARG